MYYIFPLYYYLYKSDVEKTNDLLINENEILKNNKKQLEKELKDLKYKFEGVNLAKCQIYEKYIKNILNNSNSK